MMVIKQLYHVNLLAFWTYLNDWSCSRCRIVFSCMLYFQIVYINNNNSKATPAYKCLWQSVIAYAIDFMMWCLYDRFFVKKGIKSSKDIIIQNTTLLILPTHKIEFTNQIQLLLVCINLLIPGFSCFHIAD